MKSTPILDINYKYNPTAKTNVLETFKKFGFELPSLDPRYQQKWHRVRNSSTINESKV